MSCPPNHINQQIAYFIVSVLPIHHYVIVAILFFVAGILLKLVLKNKKIGNFIFYNIITFIFVFYFFLYNQD